MIIILNKWIKIPISWAMLVRRDVRNIIMMKEKKALSIYPMSGIKSS